MRVFVMTMAVVLVGCAPRKRSIQLVDAFAAPVALTWCRSGGAVEPELLAPLPCRGRETLWEGVWKDGSVTRQCRFGSQITAQLNVALSDSGCVADLERYRLEDGVVTTVRRKGRWREAFARKLPCHEPVALCLVGAYELDRPELRVRGAFDEDSRPTGTWTLTAGDETRTVEFKAGTGVLENFGLVKRVSCSAGYVTGAFAAATPWGPGTLELTAAYERGLRQGPFRLASAAGVELEGRYDDGVPSGPWRFSARVVAMPVATALVDATCKGDCVLAGVEPPKAPAEGKDEAAKPAAVMLTVPPGYPLMPFRCHEALLESFGAPGDWVVSRFSLPQTQAFVELRKVASLAAPR
ncbi:MAG: hypothetical protein INH41_17815 [Myxococcaceae bacterium]|nr:hypothetical protein [Myxococcaceae bacterium]